MNHPVAAILFYGFSAILIAFSLAVVFSRNVFRAALSLTGALAMVSAIFALLGADFLAASQLLVYVGGVMVILLFVIVFFQRPPTELERPLNHQWFPAALVALAIGGMLLLQFRGVFAGTLSTTEAAPTTAALGRLFLGDWLVPFEVLSLVLLTALVGAVFFSRKKDSAEND